jgi:uncharacterized membrane protein
LSFGKFSANAIYDENRHYCDTYQYEAHAEGYWEGFDIELYNANKEVEVETVSTCVQTLYPTGLLGVACPSL